MDERREFGNSAEAFVEEELKKKGYRILARQFRTKLGEIDLIAQDGDEIVFVEVKARRTTEFGYPEEAVTKKKIQKIYRTAMIYLSQFHVQPSFRIDVASVLHTNKGFEVMFFEAIS